MAILSPYRFLSHLRHPSPLAPIPCPAAASRKAPQRRRRRALHAPTPVAGIQGVVPTTGLPSGIQKLQLLLTPAPRHIQRPTLCSKTATAMLLVLPAT
jgi:hypothetical protein